MDKESKNIASYNHNTQFETFYGPNIFIRLAKHLDENADIPGHRIDDNYDDIEGASGLLIRFLAFIEFLPSAMIAIPLMLLRDILIKPFYEASKALIDSDEPVYLRFFQVPFLFIASLIFMPFLNLTMNLRDISNSYKRTALGIDQLTSYKISVFATLASITLMVLIAFPPTAGIAALVSLGVQTGMAAGLGAWSTGVLIAAAGLVTKLAVEITGRVLQEIGNFFFSNLGNRNQKKIPDSPAEDPDLFSPSPATRSPQSSPESSPMSSHFHINTTIPIVLSKPKISGPPCSVPIVEKVVLAVPNKNQPQATGHSPVKRTIT